jgi:hypothetical protein
LSQVDGAIVTQRDAHVLMMEALGRLGRQEAAGYGKCSLVETAMGRYKGIIGARLRSRSWAAQQHKAAIGMTVLNRMTEARLSGDPCNNANPEAWPMYCERFERILGFRPHGQITRVT